MQRAQADGLLATTAASLQEAESGRGSASSSSPLAALVLVPEGASSTRFRRQLASSVPVIG